MAKLVKTDQEFRVDHLEVKSGEPEEED